jgi:hypothetical protein
MTVNLTLLPIGMPAYLQPRSRNWMSYLDQGFNNADELNSGGVATVSAGRTKQWPAGNSGM